MKISDIKKIAKRHGICINTDDRWENDDEHHPETVKLMSQLKLVDRINGYSARDLLETGGDGDSGETLMFLLDVIFDIRDAECSTKN